MKTSNRWHNKITVNLSACLHGQLKDRDCDGYASNMRVKVQVATLYTYPDLVITCNQPRFLDKEVDTLLNPQVIIEVLSDSTEKYDRGKKFEMYRTIPSLREYVLISQDRAHVDRFSLNEQGQWVLDDASGLDAVIELSTVGCRLPLADIYAKVEFPPEVDVPTEK